MKKIVLIVFLIFVLLFAGCAKPDKEPSGTTSTPTPAVRTEAPGTPTATPEPTPEPTLAPTAEPVATVEPGKETYAGGIKDAATGVVYDFVPQDGKTDHRMLNESLALQFFATVAFNKLEVNCPSYSDDKGTIIVEIFKWRGSYAATIDKESNPPAAKGEFVDYKDNSLLATSFDTLPDGEYLVYLTTPDKEQQVGVWGKYDAADLRARAYADGAVWEKGGIGVRISYIKTPNTLYGPIQDTGF